MLKGLLAINLVALVAFLCLWQIHLPLTQARVRMRFTDLDRAGAINKAALAGFHSSLGFQENMRANVADYIARDSLESQRTYAMVGAAFAAMNLLATYVVWMTSRVKRSRERTSVVPATVAESSSQAPPAQGHTE